MLADTNVISELARQHPDLGVIAWANSVSVLSLSVVTIEEIHFGLSRKPQPRIESWFEEFLRRHCQVAPVTEPIARAAGQLRGRLSAAGRIRTQADMLIAATALTQGLTLVTRNMADFEGCGIALLNPFTGS